MSFLGECLISWANKKKTSVATFMAKSEYVAAGSSCAQVLWIKSQLLDYGIVLKNVPMFCDNTSAIKLSKNPILHSRTKHIEIRHHFLSDHVQKDDISLKFVRTNDELADIFTKPLNGESFDSIRFRLGMCNVNDCDYALIIYIMCSFAFIYNKMIHKSPWLYLLCGGYMLEVES